MSLPEIDQLKQEHAAVGIGELLLALLWAVVRANAPAYPPAIYSPSGTWDRATLEELLQEWVSERLLRGDLSAMIEGAANTGSLRAQLGTSLKQLIINRRRRDSAGNLYKRTLDQLKRDEAFEQVGGGSPHGAPWRLAGSEAEAPSPLDLGELVQRAQELDDEQLAVVRYGPNSLKSSPILREPALREFLIHLLGRAEGTLTAPQISEVMQRRFGLLRLRQQQLEPDLADEALTELRVENEQLREALLMQLEQPELDALRRLAEHDWQPGPAAQAAGQPLAVFESALGRLANLVAEYAEDPDQAHAVLDLVVESLFSKE